MRKLTLVLLTLGLAGRALAWEPIKTDGGTPVKWSPTAIPVSYVLNDAGSDDVAFTDLRAAVTASFKSWEEVPTASITFRFAGGTSSRQTAHRSSGILSACPEGKSILTIFSGIGNSNPTK